MSSDGDELLDLRGVCEFFGGKNSPLDPSTVYRSIKRKEIPKPFKVSPQKNRWLLSECRAALADFKDNRRKK